MADMERVAAAEEIGRPIDESFDLSNFDAYEAVDILNSFIRKIYFPQRGEEGYRTERAILVGPSHAPHRENNAEHSYHIARSVLLLWDTKEITGLGFPADFNIGDACIDALGHDDIEPYTGDIDSQTPNKKLLREKKAKERSTALHLMSEGGFEGKLGERFLHHDNKDTLATMTVADLEHNAAALVISADGGKRWHYWEGYQTDCAEMCQNIRSKLSTNLGHALFDVIEEYLWENHYRLFPNWRQLDLGIEG
jgi:5'-deoxynucleotidase YfbR-like HD superfamily hydrolase